MVTDPSTYNINAAFELGVREAKRFRDEMK